MIEYSTDLSRIDWHDAVDVFARAPLGSRPREPEQLKRAFEASYAVILAYDTDRLIGLGRALCDGEYQAALYDIVLLPEYQGQGLGKALMQRLCDQLPVSNIILYAVPGREGFYEKCGFKKMRTAMASLNPFMAAPEAGYLE
jgi:GNAT superfamily N-acetyltransferase